MAITSFAGTKIEDPSQAGITASSHVRQGVQKPVSTFHAMIEPMVDAAFKSKEVYDWKQTHDTRVMAQEMQDLYATGAASSQASEEDRQMVNKLGASAAEMQARLPDKVLDIKLERMYKERVKNAPWLANELRQAISQATGRDPIGGADRFISAYERLKDTSQADGEKWLGNMLNRIPNKDVAFAVSEDIRKLMNSRPELSHEQAWEMAIDTDGRRAFFEGAEKAAILGQELDILNKNKELGEVEVAMQTSKLWAHYTDSIPAEGQAIGLVAGFPGLSSEDGTPIDAFNIHNHFSVGDERWDDLIIHVEQNAAVLRSHLKEVTARGSEADRRIAEARIGYIDSYIDNLKFASQGDERAHKRLNMMADNFKNRFNITNYDIAERAFADNPKLRFSVAMLSVLPFPPDSSMQQTLQNRYRLVQAKVDNNQVDYATGIAQAVNETYALTKGYAGEDGKWNEDALEHFISSNLEALKTNNLDDPTSDVLISMSKAMSTMDEASLQKASEKLGVAKERLERDAYRILESRQASSLEPAFESLKKHNDLLIRDGELTIRRHGQMSERRLLHLEKKLGEKEAAAVRRDVRYITSHLIPFMKGINGKKLSANEVDVFANELLFGSPQGFQKVTTDYIPD